MIMVRENMLCKRDLHRWMNNILTGFFIIIFFFTIFKLSLWWKEWSKNFHWCRSMFTEPSALLPMPIYSYPATSWFWKIAQKLSKNTASILAGPNGRVSWMRMLERRKLNLFCFTTLSCGDGYSWLPSKQCLPNIYNHSCSVKYK